MASDDTDRRVSPDFGGDPPCWSHLFDTDIESLDNDTLALLVRELADAVVICDRLGSIAFWNPAAGEEVVGVAAVIRDDTTRREEIRSLRDALSQSSDTMQAPGRTP